MRHDALMNVVYEAVAAHPAGSKIRTRLDDKVELYERVHSFVKFVTKATGIVSNPVKFWDADVDDDLDSSMDKRKFPDPLTCIFATGVQFIGTKEDEATYMPFMVLSLTNSDTIYVLGQADKWIIGGGSAGQSAIVTSTFGQSGGASYNDMSRHPALAILDTDRFGAALSVPGRLLADTLKPSADFALILSHRAAIVRTLR